MNKMKAIPLCTHPLTQPLVIAVSSEEIVMVGCHTDHYLLEKARLVSHSANERTFHIFYQLLSGGLETDLLNKFQLDDKSANYFYYLSFGDSEVDNIDDEAELNTTLAAFETLGFEPEEIEALLASLAGVLFLGNVDFVETDSDGTMAMDSSTPDLNSCASLLGVNPDRLDRAVTTKERTVRTETIISPLSKEQSTSFRDALAKAIYGAIFDWVMMKVNESMKVPVKNTMVPFIGIHTRYIWVRNIRRKLLRAALHQLLQREAPEALRRADNKEGGGNVQGEKVCRKSTYRQH